MRKELDNAQQEFDEHEALQANVARLRSDLAEALAQHKKLDEELREHKAATTAELTEWAKKMDSAQQKLDEQEALRTKAVDELATIKGDEANVQRLVERLQAQHSDDEAELTHLRRELSSAQDNAKSFAEKLRATEQDRAELSTAKIGLEKELAALRDAAKKPARSTGQRTLPTEDALRPQARATEQSGPSSSWGWSAVTREAYARMDEQVEGITRQVCLAFIKQSKEQGYDESIQTRLNQNGGKVYQAAQFMTRVALIERMAQAKPLPIAKAAEDCYRQTVTWHCKDVPKDPLGFYKWFQGSKNKEFLIVLATALILKLDARSSTESAAAVPFKLSMIPVPLTPAKPQRSAMAEFAATLRREQSQIPKPSQVQPQMPRTSRNDPLGTFGTPLAPRALGDALAGSDVYSSYPCAQSVIHGIDSGVGTVTQGLQAAGSAAGSLATALVDDGSTVMATALTLPKTAQSLIVSSSSALSDLIVATAQATARMGQSEITSCIASANSLAVMTSLASDKLMHTFAVIGTSFVNVAWRVVCSGVNDAITATKAFLNRIGAEIKKFIDYLAMLFNWGDFLDAANQAYGVAQTELLDQVANMISGLNKYRDQFGKLMTIPPASGINPWRSSSVSTLIPITPSSRSLTTRSSLRKKS